MITELIIDKSKLGAAHCRFRHAAKIANISSMKFSPGLTIVVGPNGSGKSTLLSMLAAGCLAEDAGFPLVSQRALFEMFDFDGHDRLSGLEVKHDCQVIYADSRRTPRSVYAEQINDGMVSSVIENNRARRIASLSHGGASLANTSMAMQQMAQVATPDQFVELEPMLNKRLARFNAPPDKRRIAEIHAEIVANVQAEGKSIRLPFPSAQYLLDEKRLNSVYTRRLAAARKRLKPSIPAGKPTILLDEPEANLSLPAQVRVWSLLKTPEVRNAFQIIVASHSLFAFRVIEQLGDAAQVIETAPGFVVQVRSEIERFDASNPLRKQDTCNG